MLTVSACCNSTVRGLQRRLRCRSERNQVKHARGASMVRGSRRNRSRSPASPPGRPRRAAHRARSARDYLLSKRRGGVRGAAGWLPAAPQFPYAAGRSVPRIDRLLIRPMAYAHRGPRPAPPAGDHRPVNMLPRPVLCLAVPCRAERVPAGRADRRPVGYAMLAASRPGGSPLHWLIGHPVFARRWGAAARGLIAPPN